MENQRMVRFDKEITRIVKGFALILMMLLHCYNKTNYDVALDYTYFPFYGINYSFKICVALFTFMVGYGYAFSKTKDLKYGLSHIKRLLIPYWTILFLFSLPFCMDIVVDSGLKTFLYNLFGISDTRWDRVVYLKFSWFVYFYIYTMFVLPFVSRLVDKRPVCNSIIAIVAFLGLGYVVHSIPQLLAMVGITVSPIGQTILPLAFFYCLIMTPTVILGYLFAHQGYYEKINISRAPKVVVFLICVSIIMLIITTLRPYTLRFNNPFNLDFFYAPVMIGAVAVLFNKFKWPYFRRVLSKIGELSMYMWFFHGLFFTEGVRWFYQPAITIFNDVNLVVIWTIILTFIASWLIKTIVDVVLKKLSN